MNERDSEIILKILDEMEMLHMGIKHCAWMIYGTQ